MDAAGSSDLVKKTVANFGRLDILINIVGGSADRIRINCLSPGSIQWEGGGWDEYRKKNRTAFYRYVREGFPWGRLGSPEEIADVAVFLASPRSLWINGRHVPVDGLEQPFPVEKYRLW